jgi:hypothetical protein
LARQYDDAQPSGFGSAHAELVIIIGLVTAVVIVWSHLIAQKDDIIVALQCNKRSGLLSVMQQSRNSQSAEP